MLFCGFSNAVIDSCIKSVMCRLHTVKRIVHTVTHIDLLLFYHILVSIALCKLSSVDWFVIYIRRPHCVKSFQQLTNYNNMFNFKDVEHNLLSSVWISLFILFCGNHNLEIKMKTIVKATNIFIYFCGITPKTCLRNK